MESPARPVTMSVMKLAFSCNAFIRRDVVEAIESIAAIGYQGVELMFDEPHLWPKTTSAAQLDRVRAALKSTGLQISNVNAFMMQAIGDKRQPYWHPSWIEPDPAYREIRIQHTIDSLRQAAALGASHISTEPGGPLYGAPRAAAESLFLEGVRRAARVAEEVGVTLLIEPEPELLIETASQFSAFMTQVESRAVALNFDVGHQYCVGEDPAVSFETLFPFVRHVHLEDIAATRKHHHLVPGDGAIDIAAFLRRAKSLGYAGWVTIELYPYIDDPVDAARRAFDFVRPMMDAK